MISWRHPILRASDSLIGTAHNSTTTPVRTTKQFVTTSKQIKSHIKAEIYMAKQTQASWMLQECLTGQLPRSVQKLQKDQLLERLYGCVEPTALSKEYRRGRVVGQRTIFRRTRCSAKRGIFQDWTIGLTIPKIYKSRIT